MIGLDHLNGQVDDQDRESPIYTAAPIAAFGASQLGVQGIISALLARSVTGKGEHVRSQPRAGRPCLHDAPGAGDQRGARCQSQTLPLGIDVCFLTPRCKDGRYIQMCARQDKRLPDLARSDRTGAKLEEERSTRGATAYLHGCRYPRVGGSHPSPHVGGELRRLDGAVHARVRRGCRPVLHVRRVSFASGHGRRRTSIVTIYSDATGPCKQIGPLGLFTETPTRIGAPLQRYGQDFPDDFMQRPRAAKPASEKA